MTAPAELILRSGRVWDGEHLHGVEAVAVAGHRILATGSNQEIDRLATAGTRVIDVGGRRIMPGLIDSHLHMVRAGLRWGEDVHWHDLTSLPAALERLADAAEGRPQGEWLAVMGGWHPGQFEEGRPPTRDELDEAAPNNPVFVQRNYIEAFLNSAAMTAMGWEADDGRVEGLTRLQELRANLAPPDHDAGVAGTRELLDELRRWGLTGCVDAGGFGMFPPAYAAVEELSARGELGFRARLLVGAGRPGAELDQLEEWLKAVHPGAGDDYLRYLGAGEVLVFAAHDMEGLDGRDISPVTGELGEVSARLASEGWPVHVHAILDTSVGVVLDAWEKIGPDQLSNLRFTITHADQVGEENLRRMGRLGVGVTIQNGMAFRGADSVPTWGPDLVSQAPPLRTLLESGIPLGAGTDGTVVSSPNPWRCVQWMVTGVPVDGALPRSPAQLLTIDEALRLYTSGSAWFSFEEDSRGNLREGSYADLVVLSDDPLTLSPDRLGEIESLLTVVGGDVLHTDPGL